MEAFGFRTMDMAVTTLSAADKKHFARTFMMRNHNQHLQHMLPDFKYQIHDGMQGPYCEMCSRAGKSTCDMDLDDRPFLSVGGLVAPIRLFQSPIARRHSAIASP